MVGTSCGSFRVIKKAGKTISLTVMALDGIIHMRQAINYWHCWALSKMATKSFTGQSNPTDGTEITQDFYYSSTLKKHEFVFFYMLAYHKSFKQLSKAKIIQDEQGHRHYLELYCPISKKHLKNGSFVGFPARVCWKISLKIVSIGYTCFNHLCLWVRNGENLENSNGSIISSNPQIGTTMETKWWKIVGKTQTRLIPLDHFTC